MRYFPACLASYCDTKIENKTVTFPNFVVTIYAKQDSEQVGKGQVCVVSNNKASLVQMLDTKTKKLQ